MKRIGMVVAVEIDAVDRKYGEPKEVISLNGFDVRVYENDKFTLYITKSGAGEIRAAAATMLLINEFKVDMIVNFGIVGGLTNDMKLANTCLVEKIVHYDFDTSEIDDVVPGRYLEYDDVFIYTSKHIVEKVKSLYKEMPVVTCASGDKFIGDPKKKEKLAKTYGAQICEMEAAAIVITCDIAKVPNLFIKTVSDSLIGGAGEFIENFKKSSDISIGIIDNIINSI